MLMVPSKKCIESLKCLKSKLVNFSFFCIFPNEVVKEKSQN